MSDTTTGRKMNAWYTLRPRPTMTRHCASSRLMGMMTTSARTRPHQGVDDRDREQRVGDQLREVVQSDELALGRIEQPVIECRDLDGLQDRQEDEDRVPDERRYQDRGGETELRARHGPADPRAHGHGSQLTQPLIAGMTERQPQAPAARSSMLPGTRWAEGPVAPAPRDRRPAQPALWRSCWNWAYWASARFWSSAAPCSVVIRPWRTCELTSPAAFCISP